MGSDPIAIKKLGVWHTRIGIHNDNSVSYYCYHPTCYFRTVHVQCEMSGIGVHYDNWIFFYTHDINILCTPQPMYYHCDIQSEGCPNLGG